MTAVEADSQTQEDDGHLGVAARVGGCYQEQGREVGRYRIENLITCFESPILI